MLDQINYQIYPYHINKITNEKPNYFPPPYLWHVWKFREGGEYRRVEWNSFPPPYFNVFKISKGRRE